MPGLFFQMNVLFIGALSLYVPESGKMGENPCVPVEQAGELRRRSVMVLSRVFPSLGAASWSFSGSGAAGLVGTIGTVGT
jgi:hypothetical protein